MRASDTGPRGSVDSNTRGWANTVASTARSLPALFSRFGIVFALLGLSVVMAMLTPVFFTSKNLINILLQASVNTIISVGMTFTIAAAGIDLSVGSILGLSGVLVADTLVHGYGLPSAAIVGLALGLLCGCVNGMLVSWVKLPPFVATLSSMSILRGLAMIYTRGQPIYGITTNDALQVVGYVGPIPKPVIIAAVATLVAYVIFNHSKIGQYAVAIGGNEEATVLSGINVRRYKTAIWGFCGLMAGLAGVVLTARVYAAEPLAGTGYELDAIAATVMGGTSLSGGEGKIFGTVIGAMLMSVIRNGLNLLNVQSFYQQLVIGAVILIAVAIDKLRKE